MRQCAAPWPHLEFDEFLPRDFATQIAENWPLEGWAWLRHSDAVRPDGTSLRRYQPVRDRFARINDHLLAMELPLRDALGVECELFPIAILVEDAPGYWIRKHTDCAGKVISTQCYLAQEGAPESQGVLLEGTEPKQIPYRFNHGYAFKVTKGSWHRVRRCQMVRRSIQLIFYDTPTPKI